MGIFPGYIFCEHVHTLENVFVAIWKNYVCMCDVCVYIYTVVLKILIAWLQVFPLIFLTSQMHPKPLYSARIADTAIHVLINCTVAV